MSEYFPEPKSLGETVKVELDLSNYAANIDLGNATGVDRLKIAKKQNKDIYYHSPTKN